MAANNNMDDPTVRQRVADIAAAAAPHGILVYIEDVPPYPGSKPDRKRLHIGYQTDNYWKPEYFLGDLSEEHLNDLTAYFTNHPIDKENSMNIYSTDLFQYMAGDMIGQSTIVLTIADVTMENMNSGKGGQQTKPCLRFKERSKLMVLNKTNAKTLAGILGPETENWKGARVTIAAPVVDAFGKSARSLRVTDVQPPNQIPVKTRNGHAPAGPTYADGSPVADSALDAYRDYLAANDSRPPADVRALMAWRQGDAAQDDLFGPEYDQRQADLQAAALATAQGRNG